MSSDKSLMKLYLEHSKADQRGKGKMVVIGGYIKYPDIKPNDELLFDRDGVHLSEKGTEIFLNTICAAI